jgi:hypothetical protein
MSSDPDRKESDELEPPTEARSTRQNPAQWFPLRRKLSEGPSEEVLRRRTESLVERSPEERRQLYSAYRSYIEHEDGLINNRMSWNFAIQGFLFAAFSFSAQKIAEVQEKLFADVTLKTADVDRLTSLSGVGELRILLLVLAFVGLLVSFFVYLGVWAARVAIENLEGDYNWLRDHSTYGPGSDAENKDDTYRSLPGIIGGGSPLAHGWGFQAPIFLPLIFIIAWATLIVYVLANG